MEDENGLELSLGLGCGGSSAKSKGKNGCSSETRTEEGDRGNKLADDFKDFLHAGIQKQDSSAVSQISDSVKPQENLFNDLSKAKADANASINLNNRGLWDSSSKRPSEVEDDKRPEVGNKRKILFDEINNQKKHERDAYHSDVHDKKASHISMTEDGSTAENEDVAESEVEGSSSQVVSHHDDGSKRFIGAGGPQVPKEVHGFSDSNVLQGQKRPNGSSETEIKHGNLNYGLPFSVQPANIMNLTYSFPFKESNTVGVPSSSGNSLPAMMQVMPTSSSEQRTGTQTVSPGNLPVMFGYSSAQLPTLDNDNSHGLFSHLQQFQSSYAGRGPSNSDKQTDIMKIAPGMQVISRNSSEATLYDGRSLERVKGDGKQHITEEGFTPQTEDEVRGRSMNLGAKDASGLSTAEGFSIDFSAIKPGVASDIKFGGCGSYPNLPWVTTTGSGPNGRTISGVTYRYSANQIRIVCACHGSHMFPEEFVRHASEENVNPDNGSGLASFPSTNPAASAQS
ncbi:ninja-family protein mc410 [Manihot esculenta]|uniref:Uncharacterized protein n=3 Tax=Manihot esculenta TaxID=3983 RepID=A0ACB7G7G1_MANES|nr:ninja-family protein mc410 [Manihot esculenta]XP_021597936.1 ninja-family protein mc410 [Manihot esculenta]KAG8636228.1 hypothetical protein MANES_16G111600v8 [Manihot esculenta]KAG8636229.1 hypothetical protein MANES_16G111600v8 [Manihot esculenta]OAY27255.1 hypothetical protein MANES_16G111600v8 [Manihot esculenta]